MGTSLKPSSEEPELTGAAPGGSGPPCQLSAGDHRDSTRYPCQGDAEFLIEGSEIRTFAKETDLSFGGCYVQVTSTSAAGTPVNSVVEVNRTRFRVQGVVKTSDPCLGMGIAFTKISSADREYLECILVSLSTGAQRETPGPEVPRNVDAHNALEALAELFRSTSFITRDEFLYTVRKFVRDDGQDVAECLHGPNRSSRHVRLHSIEANRSPDRCISSRFFKSHDLAT